jgi:hypothetical protein
MNYEINIITRDMIPSNIYLCNIDEWTKINHFKFENGLQCIVGANRHLSSKDAIESINDELDNVLENNNPEELQQYYYDNFENFISYSDCVKIFNYYYENEVLIKEAYYTYFDREENYEEESDEEIEELDEYKVEDEDETQIISDDIRDKIDHYMDKYMNKAIKLVSQKVAKKISKKIIKKVVAEKCS